MTFSFSASVKSLAEIILISSSLFKILQYEPKVWMIFYKSLNLKLIKELPSWFNEGFKEVIGDLVVLLWSEWWNDFSLLISLDSGVFKELFDEWLPRDDFSQMGEVLQNDVQGFVFRSSGEQCSGVSSSDVISDGWWLMTLIISVEYLERTWHFLRQRRIWGWR